MMNKQIILLVLLIVSVSNLGLCQSEIKKHYYLDTIAQKELLRRLEYKLENKMGMPNEFSFAYINFGIVQTTGVMYWENAEEIASVCFDITSEDSIRMETINHRMTKKFQRKLQRLGGRQKQYLSGFMERTHCNGSSMKNDEYYFSILNSSVLEYVHYDVSCAIRNNDGLSNLFFKALSILTGCSIRN